MEESFDEMLTIHQIYNIFPIIIFQLMYMKLSIKYYILNDMSQITINRLNEEVDEKNADLKVQKLKEEKLKKDNNRLHQLVNKYRQGKDGNRISVGCQTEEVRTYIVIQASQ